VWYRKSGVIKIQKEVKLPVRIYRYILAKFTSQFAVGTGVFTALLLMEQASRQVDMLAAHMRSLSQFFISFLLLAPSLLTFSLPLAFLMAMISTLEQMKNDQELPAIYSAGVSPLSVFTPFFAASIVVFTATLVTTLYISPASFKAYNTRFLEMARDLLLNDLKPGYFFRGIPGTVLIVNDFDPGTGEITNLLLVQDWSDDKGDIILAKRGTLVIPSTADEEIQLKLHDGTIEPVSAPEEEYRSASFDTLATVLKNPKSNAGISRKDLFWAMSLEEMRSTLIMFRRAGRTEDAIILLTEIHRRFSIPFTLLIYPFIVFPIAVSSRKHGKASAFTATILLFALSVFLFAVGMRLGAKGQISPWIAAWLPDIVLGAFGLASFIPFMTKQFPGQLSDGGGEAS
jgi:LPS export ABC transporter permease LptF